MLGIMEGTYQRRGLPSPKLAAVSTISNRHSGYGHDARLTEIMIASLTQLFAMLGADAIRERS